MEKVKVIHGQNDEEQEGKRLKAKIWGLNSQLDALGERIAILPKAVSAVPLFKQMEKLELAKKEHEERLLKVKELNLDQRLVPLETFENFARQVSKSLKEATDFNVRRMTLQKFIRRVEIGTDSVKIYWNLDKEFYERELKIKKPEARGSGFLKIHTYSVNSGSQSFTNGAR